MSTTKSPLFPNVGQFNYVWADDFRTFGKIKFRVVGYGAYNAMGLIGPEMNGIAILSETEKAVVTDMIANDQQAFYLDGASPKQQAEFNRLMTCNESDFKAACLSGRSRYTND